MRNVHVSLFSNKLVGMSIQARNVKPRLTSSDFLFSFSSELNSVEAGEVVFPGAILSQLGER